MCYEQGIPRPRTPSLTHTLALTEASKANSSARATALCNKLPARVRRPCAVVRASAVEDGTAAASSGPRDACRASKDCWVACRRSPMAAWNAWHLQAPQHPRQPGVVSQAPAGHGARWIGAGRSVPQHADPKQRPSQHAATAGSDLLCRPVCQLPLRHTVQERCSGVRGQDGVQCHGAQLQANPGR